MMKQKTSNLHFAGLDWILNSDGKWVLLEVNDHPIGLLEADEMYKKLNCNSFFNTNSFTSLAEMLVRNASNQAICLLLPDFFRVNTPTHTAIAAYPSRTYADTRIEWVLREFNMLAKQIRLLGSQCFISDIEGVELQKEQILLKNGIPVGTLFRRASKYPPEKPNCFCVNDLRLRLLCVDKLKTYNTLQGKMDVENLVETDLLTKEETLIQNLFKFGIDKKDIIVKPKFGSASNGITKITSDEILNNKYFHLLDSNFPMIYQEWIEPATVRDSKDEYYYDIRIYTLLGNPVTGFARRSAAPKKGILSRSPLSWLTTTGPTLPLCHTSSVASKDSVRLTTTQIEDLLELSSRVTVLLDKAADELNYSATYKMIPSFANIAGISEKVKIIMLEAN